MPTDETRPMDSGDGKPSRKSLSEDGRGGTKPGARYIYYRLYTKDGPLESNQPIYSNDRFISRIASKLVRPPQTAASLTRYLCKIEGLEHRKAALYQSLSDNTALDDSTRLLFRGTAGPGPSDVDPVALIFDTRAAEKRSQASSSVESQKLLERDYEQRYVYYRVYDDDGGAVSKMSFDENDPSLGRVNTLSVPPPHTVSCLKNFIIISEGISGHDAQLFEDEASESAMNNSDALTLLSDTFPGFTEDQPIAITYESGKENAGNEDPDEIQTRELKEALAHIKKEFEDANLTHARELKEAGRQHARELEEAKRTHTRELAEATGRWKMAEETHAREREEANRRQLAEVREESKRAKETHARELKEAKRTHAREHEEANRRHARELAEAREESQRAKETHAREREEANRKHARELAEVREESQRAKETHEQEICEARFALLKAQSKLPSTFTKQLKATRDCSDGENDATWHSTKTGEIFCTDGILRKERWHVTDINLDGYLATNSSGKQAFVDFNYVDFC